MGVGLRLPTIAICGLNNNSTLPCTNSAAGAPEISFNSGGYASSFIVINWQPGASSQRKSCSTPAQSIKPSMSVDNDWTAWTTKSCSKISANLEGPMVDALMVDVLTVDILAEDIPTVDILSNAKKQRSVSNVTFW